MNAKVLTIMMFALLPSAALAQSSDQTKSQANQSGGQGTPAGKNGNGSDANGALTPGGRGIRRKRDHCAVVKAPRSDEVEPLRAFTNTCAWHRPIYAESN